MVWLWAAILLMGLLAASLAIKVVLLRKSARTLREELLRRRQEETNTLLSLPNRDGEMRKLAACLNKELRLLRQQRLQYQQGDRELKDAVAGISHDLRTPLTAISGYLELLKSQPLSPDARRYLEQVESRTQAMKRLTQELFQYSVAASSQELELQPVDLGRALEETLLAFYGALESRGITPEIHLTETKVVRSLDPAALNRVLGNLLSNALKYSAGDLTVTLEETGRMTFTNSAPELDSVTAGRLFDRFYTVEAAKNSTGLGLSIARELTQRMGGTIHASFFQGQLTVSVEW
ncbi:MAG: sensor histidine kinase [Acutalibacter sp.]|jgi:signal transduction histidine kinase